MEKNYEAINLLQPESEHDPFTEERYSQFFKYLPKGAQKILDIGCNTGRGGKVLKTLNPDLRIYVLVRVENSPGNIAAAR